MLGEAISRRTSYDPQLKTWAGRSVKSASEDDPTIGQIIFKQLQKEPKRICQISHSEKTQLTRAQMLDNSIRCATYLRDAGFKEETDIVGILASNSTHLAALAYGCMFNGTPVNQLCPGIDRLDTSQILVADELDSEIITLYGQVAGVKSILDLLELPLEEHYQPASFERGSERLLAICSTSGSTGFPKASTRINSRRIFCGTDEVQFDFKTCEATVGLLCLINAGIYGTLRIICMDLFDPHTFLAVCEEHRVTFSLLFTPAITALAKFPSINANALSSLRHLKIMGAVALASPLEQLQNYLPEKCIIENHYGMTETCCHATNRNVKSNPTSVGQLSHNVRMRVMDADGNMLGPNKVGEILVHTGERWLGYYGNPAATAHMQDADGWFHTGDLGYFDDDHELYIVGRKKEMLRCDMFMYYPQQIEAIIIQMPEVADACVFGIWHELLGDEAAASVMLKPGCELLASQVVDFVQQRTTAKYKQLLAGALIVDHLERTRTGKLRREAIKQHFLKATSRLDVSIRKEA
ncbi:4-coumarate--CoA ligase 1 [Drosophila busckii]|uniref:4-coumarate--CoA ligase 1 n=1 Tax=Drosophila busckii TaxID=30019 RepID=UPI001432BE1C|nr:4-coumarate--CoA ligase 1 [Drosophila busckii]